MSDLIRLIHDETLQTGQRLGLPVHKARELAASVEERLRRDLGGSDAYVPALSREERNQRIRAEWNGRNRRELQRRWGLSQSQLYRIVGSK